MSGRGAPRHDKVKNKMPAAVQITAEQLIKDARDRQDPVITAPKQEIADEDELNDLKLRKRKEFENFVRKNRANVAEWIKYANFEEKLNEFERARSIYERALDVDHRAVGLWMKYAEFEMKHKHVSHARNIWDRAVAFLPRVNQFWYKYVYMEEVLGNVPAARQIFERWMEWEPDEQAWLSYIKMELRYKEVERAREIYERFVVVHPEAANWVRYARFEERVAHSPEHSRAVYERAVAFFGDTFISDKLILAFSSFEESQHEIDRARVVLQYALDRVPREKAHSLVAAFTQFEKKHGDRKGVEEVIVAKRRQRYEEEVSEDPHNYDAWFDYVRLEETAGNTAKTTDVYRRAIANLPPGQEKRLWRRYIYLWLYYAVWAEVDAKDPTLAREVYETCLFKVIPHRKFTFTKMWIAFAHFLVRQKALTEARKVLGMAIGMCPKHSLFRRYIEMELSLRDFDRARKLYEKHLEFSPSSVDTWVKYAELETVLNDTERARGLYELAVSTETGIQLDMPELLWKAYIDFELQMGSVDRARDLYTRLLKRTQHVKVWLSYARFEEDIAGDGDATEEERAGAIERTREVYTNADKSLSRQQREESGDEGVGAVKEARVVLLNEWATFERRCGDDASRALVAKKMPAKVKKRRPIVKADGTAAGLEEYIDNVFPDESEAPNLKLLQMAHQWKLRQQQLEAQKTATAAAVAPAPVHDEPAVVEDDNDD